MSITVTIANQSQWSANQDMEMKLIFKRAYFKPGFMYNVSGLNPLDEYYIYLEVRQVDNYRYKLAEGVYIKYQELTERDHPILAPQCARLPEYSHQQSVSGSQLGHLIDFSNVFFVKKGRQQPEEDKGITIELETVFKYEPCVVVVQKDGSTFRFPQPCQQFVTVSSKKRDLVEIDDGQPAPKRQRTRRPAPVVVAPLPPAPIHQPSPIVANQYAPVVYTPPPYWQAPIDYYYPAPMPYFNVPPYISYYNQPYFPPVVDYLPDPVQAHEPAQPVVQPPQNVVDPVVEDPEVEKDEDAEIPDVMNENVDFDAFEALFNDENMEEYLADLEKD